MRPASRSQIGSNSPGRSGRPPRSTRLSSGEWKSLPLSSLTFFIKASTDTAVRIHEQVLADGVGVFARGTTMGAVGQRSGTDSIVPVIRSRVPVSSHFTTAAGRLVGVLSLSRFDRLGELGGFA